MTRDKHSIRVYMCTKYACNEIKIEIKNITFVS